MLEKLAMETGKLGKTSQLWLIDVDTFLKLNIKLNIAKALRKHFLYSYSWGLVTIFFQVKIVCYEELEEKIKYFSPPDDNSGNNSHATLNYQRSSVALSFSKWAAAD